MLIIMTPQQKISGKKKKFKEKVGGLLKGDSLMVNDDIPEDTILKELKHTKNSKSENLGEAQSHQDQNLETKNILPTENHFQQEV